MNYIVSLSLLGLLTVGVGSEAAAQQKLPFYMLDPIVVTATRTATPRSLVGSSVEVVSGEELRASGATTLLEALATVPGVAITRNGPAAGTGSLFLRGGKSEHLLVLIDGVEVNDPISPGGAFDWNTLPADAIDRVEIVKGPQSTLYGSDAMAGVVNIITRAPDEGRRTLSVEAGSFSTLNTSAGISGRAAGTDFRIEIARRQLGEVSSAADRYDGNSEEDAWSMWSGALKLRRSLGGGVLEATLRGSRSRFDVDDYGGPFGDDPNNRAWRADLTGTVTWRSAPAPYWQQRVVLGGSRTHRWGIDRADAGHPEEEVTSDYRGRIQSGEWHHIVENGRHRLAFGASAERESGGSRFTGTDMGYTYGERLPEARQWALSTYLQDQIQLGRAAITLGGRLDGYTDYGAQPTYRVAVTGPVGRVRLRASYGTGFRAPSLYQRFSSLFGSADLKAEESTAWDAGLEVPLAGRGSLEITRYNQDVEKLIDFVTDPTTFLSRYENRGEVHMEGWEASMRLVLSSSVGIDGSLTLMDTRDRTGDRPLLRRPKRIVALGVQMAPARGWRTLLRVRHVGERDDLDFSSFPAPRITLAAVTLLEGYVSFALTPEVTLRLRGENLTDEDPEWVWGYGSRGRAFYAAVIVNR